MGRNIVSGDDVGHWVAAQFGGSYFSEKSQTLGLERDGKLIAGVIFENWNHASIMCHTAILGRMTPLFLHLVFRYPFVDLNVRKIIAPIYSDNVKALRLVGKLGFTEESRITGAAPNGDIIFLTMARDQCRFLGDRYGHKISSTSDT
jgi:RimJ/RimL family protein N-acetyltransferase